MLQTCFLAAVPKRRSSSSMSASLAAASSSDSPPSARSMSELERKNDGVDGQGAGEDSRLSAALREGPGSDSAAGAGGLWSSNCCSVCQRSRSCCTTSSTMSGTVVGRCQVSRLGTLITEQQVHPIHYAGREIHYAEGSKTQRGLPSRPPAAVVRAAVGTCLAQNQMRWNVIIAT